MSEKTNTTTKKITVHVPTWVAERVSAMADGEQDRMNEIVSDALELQLFLTEEPGSAIRE